LDGWVSYVRLPTALVAWALGAAYFDELPAARRDQLRTCTAALRLQMQTLDRYFPPITCTDLRKLVTPVLLLGGDRSPDMFGPILAELKRCLPHTEFQVIPNAGHNMQIDNPAAFNRQVLAFFRAH
jgi:pimeloyl-ACP methyl ester carboxylesterase